MLLVDTGPLVAAADRDDADHEPSRRLLETHPGPLVTSPLVVAEAAYLIDRQLGPHAEAAFFQSITAGDIQIDSLRQADWEWITELVRVYADLRLGGTDASLVALAERLAVTTIGTLNHRHFRVVRPIHANASHLLP